MIQTKSTLLVTRRHDSSGILTANLAQNGLLWSCMHSLCPVGPVWASPFNNFPLTTFIAGHNRRRTAPFAFSGGLLPVETSSEESFSWAMDMIRKCNDSHLCYDLSKVRLPNRVLDISGAKPDSDVKLHITSNEAARYVCLSHCWGASGSRIITTHDNIAEHIRGISFESLPKTFKDAIKIAQRFDVQYIWIDSLCIIQDSEEDWEKESCQMADIYENAYFTIAATASSNGDGGCFRSVPPEDRDRRFEYRPSKFGQSIPIFFRNILEHPDDRNLVKLKEAEFPLLQRAWVFQERVLSSRFLHFSRRELIFECKQSCHCQCGYGRMNQKERLRWSWDECMDEYSGLSLTYQRDRLPALSGLARRKIPAQGDVYLAGMWRSEPPESLAWVAISDGSAAKRPTEPRPPSWSWASTESQVNWLSTYEDTFDVKIQDVHCTLLGNDKFGQVKSGSLILEGRCFPAHLSWLQPERSSQSPFSEPGQSQILWSLEASEDQTNEDHKDEDHQYEDQTDEDLTDELEHKVEQNGYSEHSGDDTPEDSDSDSCGQSREYEFFSFHPDYDFYNSLSSPTKIYCLFLSSVMDSDRPDFHWKIIVLRSANTCSTVFKRIGIAKLNFLEADEFNIAEILYRTINII
jgi:hypothetical protein